MRHHRAHLLPDYTRALSAYQFGTMIQWLIACSSSALPRAAPQFRQHVKLADAPITGLERALHSLEAKADAASRL